MMQSSAVFQSAVIVGYRYISHARDTENAPSRGYTLASLSLRPNCSCEYSFQKHAGELLVIALWRFLMSSRAVIQHFFPVGPCLCIEWGGKLKWKVVYEGFNFYLKIRICLTLESKKATVLNDDLLILWWEDTTVWLQQGQWYSEAGFCPFVARGPLCLRPSLLFPGHVNLPTVWVSSPAHRSSCLPPSVQ